MRSSASCSDTNILYCLCFQTKHTSLKPQADNTDHTLKYFEITFIRLNSDALSHLTGSLFARLLLLSFEIISHPSPGGKYSQKKIRGTICPQFSCQFSINIIHKDNVFVYKLCILDFVPSTCHQLLVSCAYLAGRDLGNKRRTVSKIKISF